MNGNYEWQRQQAQQRIQKRYNESRQYRLSKQRSSGGNSDQGANRAARLPLRLVTAILNLLR